MTDFGAVPTQIPAGVIVDANYAEASGISTSSATLEDITGCTFDIDVPAGVTARVYSMMTFQAESTGAGGSRSGAWAISINSIDGSEHKRDLSGTADIGIGAVQARSAVLTAGTYTVVGRHRKVSGLAGANIITDNAQLSALVILE